MTMLTRRKLLFCCLTGVLLAGLLEAVCYIGCRHLQKSGVVYRPYSNPEYSQYVERRDKVLGWPAPETFGCDGQRDVTGSRVVPSCRDPEKYPAYISLYGDSYTWGTGVDHPYVWGNLLSEKLGVRVSDYGVRGYGTDQALLRFLHNTSDEAPVVFLNHLSENILRNINQYRQLLYPGDGLGFKPRFLVDEYGRLTLVPLPDFSASEYAQVVYDPASYLRHEYFVPDGPGGIQRLSAPFTWAVLKSAASPRVWATLRGVPWYTPFYDPDHPSDALAVTVAIFEAFYEKVRTRGRIPVLTVMPTGRDLRFYQRKGEWPYKALMDELDRRQISFLNFGVGIVRYLGPQDPRTLFLSNRIGAHCNEAGHRLLARVALEYLDESGLLPAGERAPQLSVPGQILEEVYDGS